MTNLEYISFISVLSCVYTMYWCLHINKIYIYVEFNKWEY